MTDETRLQLEAMERKLAIMQWDVDHDQMNPAKMTKYQKLKEELTKLKEALETT